MLDLGLIKIDMASQIFNEILSSKDILQENESIHYPLRTSSYGDWSGLRIEMSTRTDIAISEDIDGVIIIVQHPDQWPNYGHFVPTGSQTAVVIKSTYSYTTEDVRRLSPEQRQCLNVSETCQESTKLL